MNEEPFTPSGITTATAQPGTYSESGVQHESSATEETIESTKAEARRMQSSARETGAAAMHNVKSGAQSAVQQAQEAGRSFLHSQKESLASRVSAYAEAARSASECLSANEGNLFAAPARNAADQLERISSFLHNAHAEDVLGEFESFARRRPEVVFGGMFIAGLLASRFLKASGKRAHERRMYGEEEWQEESFAGYEETTTSAVPVASGASSASTLGTIPHPVTTEPYSGSSPGITSSGGTTNTGTAIDPKL